MFLLIPALTLPIIGASAAGPVLTATPDAASAGTRITVRGSNFTQDLPVVLEWDGEQLDGDDLVASGGSFEATIKIPAGSAAGEHTLSASIVAEATETSEASTQGASTSVVVTADEEPAPEPPTPVEPAAPPTEAPPADPTEAPPTEVPPTEVPTDAPVASPTEAPTEAPTPVPPTSEPTPDPTPAPTATAAPTATPEATPAPTATASTAPPATPVPTATPIATPPPPPAVTPPPAATLPPPPAPPAAPPAPVAAPVLVPAPPAILPIIAAPKKVPRKTPCADGKFYVEYFNEMALANSLKRKTRCESYVSKDWGLGSPGFGLRSNWFSVRWTTRVNMKAGTYRFNYQADNGIRVWVDGVLVVDRWYGGGSGWVARSIKGGRHLIRVAYFEDAGSAKAMLSYKRISTTLTLTPPQMPVLIAPPVQTTKPAPVISPPPPVTNPVPVLPPPPAPVVPPPPAQAPTPAPAAPPAGLPGPVSCSTPLATLINNAAAGSTLNLGSCVYTSSIDIRKPIRLYGGVYRLPRGATAVNISADDVTIEGARFEGGGYTVQVHGRDRARILNSSFTGMTETSIGINGPSADDTLIQGNTIIQSVRTSHGYSPISGQGFGRGMNRNLVIRNNTVDQGPSGVAWFGIEVWDNVGLVIEGNLLKGASALVSIPRSDGAIVRNNQFDMTQAFWGIELADVDDAQVYGNNVWGSNGNNGPDGRAFVQMHPGSGTVLRNTVRNNRLTNYWALVNAAGSGHTITNNCLSGVKKLTAFSFTGATTISGNGPC